MKMWVRIATPLAVTAAGLAAGMVLMATGPKTERKRPPPVVPVVEAMTVVEQDYPIKIRSRGTVSPRTQSTLIPEVSGRIVKVSPALRSGGFFEKGEELLHIDSTDYDNAVVIARADLAKARLTLAQEEAQADQARRDWERLAPNERPSALVVRQPQVDSARAEVAAAEARLAQAETDLARTRILAPYAGRVLQKQVDVGQYVSPGTVVATIYAVDYVEIRLPLTDNQVGFVDLPEQYRGSPSGMPAEKGAAVTLTAIIGQDRYGWHGRLVRTDGAIDTANRQLFVVAQVDDPYARHGSEPPLKVGQFVEAEIDGRVLRHVFVLPRSILEPGDKVLVIDDQHRLQRRPVEVRWRDGENVVVTSGLSAGERVSLTAMVFAAEGTVVRVQGEETLSQDGMKPASRKGG
ncbi:MAG: efflux RND transporter periplasmic adaptor subunit [Gammaproteobacteria bacterium]|nr:efflux RND transporter periplasmic adaptor subunit [Gammaproteobacteria bacterium]